MYDIRFQNQPFIFQDQDKGTQEADSEEKAMKMCDMLNAVIHSATFVF